MNLPVVQLKPGKDVPLRAGHPWIFSLAIQKEDTHLAPGSCVRVVDNSDRPLGIGTYNPLTNIRVRLLTRDVNEAIDAPFFETRFAQLDTWKRGHLPEKTNGYRLVHAEADGLPGLIIDRYANVFVFQLHTAGMELLRDLIIEALQNTFQPDAIMERSDVEARGQEGLHDRPIKLHRGIVDGQVAFQEHGLTFFADVLKGQKTGFFLDQRDARHALATYARDKHIVNLFSYTGAFSVHALQGGATSVTSVDLSRSALELAQQQIKANGFDPEDEKRCTFLQADVMDLLNDERSLSGTSPDIIVCDPPAFAKHREQTAQAIKAYTDLNMRCLKRLQVGGILMTSSCSGRISAEDFRSLLRIAAGRAGRDVRLLEWIDQPIDHAERLAFPEGRYLKTAILEVTEILA